MCLFCTHFILLYRRLASCQVFCIKKIIFYLTKWILDVQLGTTPYPGALHPPIASIPIREP